MQLFLRRTLVLWFAIQQRESAFYTSIGANVTILTAHQPKASVYYSRLYSVLKLFTGFANAAFIAWKLIVSNATTIADMPAIKNIHIVMSTLYT